MNDRSMYGLSVEESINNIQDLLLNEGKKKGINKRKEWVRNELIKEIS